MKRLLSILYILAIICVSIAFTGCYDDGLGYNNPNDNEGEAMLTLQADFTPFSNGTLTRSSNVSPARGFNTLSDLTLLVFDKNVKYIPEKTLEVKNPEASDSDRTDADASNGQAAETNTLSVSGISLKLPFGTYYIIGVANFGEYKSNGSEIEIVRTSKSILEERISEIGEESFTLDDLRRIKVEWDENEYANNREMLGFFTTSSGSPSAKSTFDMVKVDRSGIKLRAWLRRCASKITVDFDGSSLRDNIRIFIKDVKVYDIAKECTLGFGESYVEDEGSVPENFNNHPGINNEDPIDVLLVNSAENAPFIEFGEGEDYFKWPVISKLHPFITEGDNPKKLHEQDSECLYFYENMQGTKEGYDRSPIPDLSSESVMQDFNRKDGVKYGTYVEVTAHYVSDVSGSNDDYEIKYRFMLGKNVIDNFDAERNYHYKLTLQFLGNANEYRWHIDYDHHTGFKVPNPWYVSYLYSQDAYLPFEFSMGEGEELIELKAEIITNPWYPTNGEETDDETLRDPSKTDLTPIPPTGDPAYHYEGSNIAVSGQPWNGFLSLRAPSENTILSGEDVGHTWGGYDKEISDHINKDYYINNMIGMRTIYTKENGFDISNSQDEFVQQREKISGKHDKNTNTFSVSMPLFTREKSLVKQTGYTGNNPFVGFQRVAQLKLTAIVKDKDGNQKPAIEQLVNVIQVRRVVNPKGVYRKEGNYEPFHVRLKFQSDEGSTATFRDIRSRGPWMAEILGDENFITLDGKQRISGSANDPIDFTIRFNRMAKKGNKNAIVRIKYHNYTCSHLIFVRQGLEDQALSATGRNSYGTSVASTIWSTFNMIAENKLAEDPRDEGSMFKFGNSSRGIDTYNNAYRIDGKEAYYDLTLNDFKPDGPFFTCDQNGEDFSVDEHGNAFVSNSQRKWDWTEMQQNVGGFTQGKAAKAATIYDFEQLYLTKHINFGYGVLYADGATETQESLEYVNGWHRHDKSGVRDKKGMRGVFAYYFNTSDLSDPYNGKSIFFPIGRSGYGHRKEGYGMAWGSERLLEAPENKSKGILRYAAARYRYAKDDGGVYEYFQKVSPLFETLYRRPGAIYWARHIVPPGQSLDCDGRPTEAYNAYGLDLNYFTLDVNVITGFNVGDGNDACFVRTVSN